METLEGHSVASGINMNEMDGVVSQTLIKGGLYFISGKSSPRAHWRDGIIRDRSRAPWTRILLYMCTILNISVYPQWLRRIQKLKNGGGGRSPRGMGGRNPPYDDAHILEEVLTYFGMSAFEDIFWFSIMIIFFVFISSFWLILGLQTRDTGMPDYLILCWIRNRKICVILDTCTWYLFYCLYC